MKEIISRVYVGETEDERKQTPQPLQHEIMNQSFQTDMRTSWVRLSTVYVRETGNEGKPRPQPLQHEEMNHPFQTVQWTPTIPHAPYISTKSAIFTYLRAVNSQFEHDHGRRASRLIEHTLVTDVCVLPEYQTAGKYDTSSILSANLCNSSIYTRNTSKRGNGRGTRWGRYILTCL